VQKVAINSKFVEVVDYSRLFASSAPKVKKEQFSFSPSLHARYSVFSRIQNMDVKP
jgi:hypothetical protein